MNLYNIWVSLSEMSDKKILNFFMIFNFFFDVPVLQLFFVRAEEPTQLVLNESL